MQGVNANLFNIGKTALYAFRQGMGVTGQNIANASSAGYSRQRLVLSANTPYASSVGLLSSGVTVVRVESVRDAYLHNRIMLETQELGKWETMSETAKRLENIFSESTSYGLNTLMSEFWNSWQETANSPLGYAERTVLIGSGDRLANRIRSITQDMTNLKYDLDSRVKLNVSTINQLASSIANLYGKIGIFEKSGSEASDLRDSREQLLKELASLIDINILEDEEGMTAVMLSNGRPLVSKGVSWNIIYRSLLAGSGTDGLTTLFWHDASVPDNEINSAIQSGKLNTLIQARDMLIPQYMQQLDDLAAAIINQVNALHQAGDDLHGNPGIAFFSGSGASDIAMGFDQPELVAAAEAGGGAGDNRNAIAIAGLGEQLIMNDNTASFYSFLAAMTASAGNESLQAQRHYEYRRDMLELMENYRESVSGVSLDEEMINLIQYQHAYSSAAKLISASDEMLKTLLAMI